MNVANNDKLTIQTGLSQTPFILDGLPSLPPIDFSVRGPVWTQHTPPSSFGRTFLKRPSLSDFVPVGTNSKHAQNMIQWFRQNYPDESLTVNNLTLLRQTSYPVTPGQTSVDWGNTLISDTKEWQYETDVNKYLKKIAKFAILWHLQAEVAPRNRMPENIFHKYANLFERVSLANKYI
jgi:hypothetical protein